MYAVIKTGGKQHRVQAGDVIEVGAGPRRRDASRSRRSLVVDDDGKAHVGKEVAKATVTAKLVGETEGRQGQGLQVPAEDRLPKKTGHRQMYTLVEIDEDHARPEAGEEGRGCGGRRRGGRPLWRPRRARAPATG